MRHTAAVDFLHVLLEILLGDLLQFVFFEFLFLVALTVINDLFAADILNQLTQSSRQVPPVYFHNLVKVLEAFG